MNYDSILAIYNCFKDKIKYLPPQKNIKKEITKEIKEWYEESKKTNNQASSENIQPNILTIKEGNSGELCIYYITPRQSDQRVITNSSDKEKILEKLINESRDKIIKETIYNYLKNVLKNIDIPPFNTKKLDEQSIYECKAISNNNEQIKIDYDDSSFTTCIKMTSTNKHFKISLLPQIISTRHDGMITIKKTQKKSNIFSKLFEKKSKFELINQETCEFVSITKDEINSKCQSTGTIYEKEGVYIFEATNNIFTINYFDQETINTITSTNLNKKFELTAYIKLLRDKKELTNIGFIEKLEETGLLPNATFKIPCTPKELQILVNKAFINAKSLIEDLYKTN